MRIADFDKSTRKVVYLAHIVARTPTADNLARLQRAVEEFDKEHEAERALNLITALFGSPGEIMKEKAALPICRTPAKRSTRKGLPPKG